MPRPYTYIYFLENISFILVLKEIITKIIIPIKHTKINSFLVKNNKAKR